LDGALEEATRDLRASFIERGVEVAERRGATLHHSVNGIDGLAAGDFSRRVTPMPSQRRTAEARRP